MDSIPKIIHFFWEGGGKPRLARKCLASWRRVMPDWEVKEWNLERLKAAGIEASCPFLDETLARKKWGFVSDVVRWAVLEREGGIFLDADVELVKPMPSGEAWIAAERDDPLTVAPGLGVAFPPHHPFVRAMLDEYATLHFDPDNMLECASPKVMTRMLDRQDVPRILPARVMNPLGWSGGRLGELSDDCRAIHWYAASWLNWKQRLVYVTLPRMGIDVGKWLRKFKT